MKLPRRRWLVSRFGLALLPILLAIQLVPYGRAHVNLPIVAEPAWDAPATRALAKQACFDCHSNETEWPSYSRVAPVSWLIQHDVDEGRAVLNFSEWQRPQEEASEAVEQVMDRKMPPRVYQLMHSQAQLSDAQRDRLAKGLAATLQRSSADELEDEP